MITFGGGPMITIYFFIFCSLCPKNHFQTLKFFHVQWYGALGGTSSPPFGPWQTLSMLWPTLRVVRPTFCTTRAPQAPPGFIDTFLGDKTISRLKLCMLQTKFYEQQPSLRMSQQNLAIEEAKICLSISSFIIFGKVFWDFQW